MITHTVIFNFYFIIHKVYYSFIIFIIVCKHFVPNVKYYFIMYELVLYFLVFHKKGVTKSQYICSSKFNYLNNSTSNTFLKYFLGSQLKYIK